MLAYALVRLVLNLDAPWTTAAPAQGEALAFARDDVPARLHTTPLYDRFAPPTRGLADEPGVEIVGDRITHSALGWPVRVIERVLTPSGAPARREIEVRYAMFELGGAAVVTGPADAIARCRDELVATMLDGRPDWRDGVACLAELLPEP